MTITIELPPDTEKKLQARASTRGQDVPGYVRQLIERDVHIGPTLDEVLDPIRRGFQASGLSEDELDRMFDEARDEVWREKQLRSGGP